MESQSTSTYCLKDLVKPFKIRNTAKFLEKVKREHPFFCPVKMTEEGKTMFEKANLNISIEEDSKYLVEVRFTHKPPFIICKQTVFYCNVFSNEDDLCKGFDSLFDIDVVCKKCFCEPEDCKCEEFSEIFDFGNETCAICFEELPLEPIQTLCKHMFHTQCIYKHLNVKNKNECPLCRQALLKYEDLHGMHV